MKGFYRALPAAFALACAACAGAPARGGPEAGRAAELVKVVRRKPFRYDAETEKALDGLCALKGSEAGLAALRRQYEFLEGLDKGTARIEACLVAASSATIAQNGAREWRDDLAEELDDAKQKPVGLMALVERQAAYDGDKPKYERKERLLAILDRFVPQRELDREARKKEREAAAANREGQRDEIIRSLRDWLLRNGTLSPTELSRLDGGEGVFRTEVHFLDEDPPAAEVFVDSFLPFRGTPSAPSDARPGPSTLQLRLIAEKAGDRWLFKERR